MFVFSNDQRRNVKQRKGIKMGKCEKGDKEENRY